MTPPANPVCGCQLIYCCDVEGRVTFHNAAFALFFGESAQADLRGRFAPDLLTPRSRREVVKGSRRQIRLLIPVVYREVQVRTPSGGERWLGQTTQLLTEGGKAVGFQAVAKDITGSRNAQHALAIAEERFALAVRGSHDGIWDWDLRNGKAYYSAGWKRIVGLPESTVCETPKAWLSRVHPDDAGGLERDLYGYASNGTGLFEREYRIRHTDGTWRWVSSRGAAVREGGRAIRIAGSLRDITPGKLADPLTGLPNRLAILDRLERLFERHKEKPGRDFAVLFLDLDRFKLVNDSLGHKAGDELLVNVSRRILTAMRSCCVEGGCVGRLGGDEFVVLLDQLPESREARRLAAAILQEMEEPFRVAGKFVCTTTSIGIAFGSGPGCSPESALQNADAAMYHAKAAGRGQYAVFDGSMHARAVERLHLETDLRAALEQGEFLLYYQPQVCLRTGRLTGFEALVRWKHPMRGLVNPVEFIAVAEETGLIIPLGRSVVEEACRQLAEWRTCFGIGDVTVSVNWSSRQFADSELVNTVRDVLKKTGLPPRNLRLELTERILAADPERAKSILSELAKLGVGLEIDDFGTGYSSLTQLHQLPFDTLKVDRSFVQAMERQSEGRKIVDSIASLAESLGISVVAEGVEKEEHWLQLVDMGCHVGQGYFFGPPVGVKGTTELIRLRSVQNWTKPDAAVIFSKSLSAFRAAGAVHAESGAVVDE
jgi:diguanylate cyclase (GGDEF)-like protein/PAS domain S-box-containing protein